MNKTIFGITGATGAGKSTVSKIFTQLGVFVADADLIAREVVKPGMPCLNEIKNAFGEKIIRESGELDRKKLGAIVFANHEKLKILNEITHKYINEEVKRRIDESESELCAIDGAVLIGSPIEDMCRYMVCVLAPVDIRRLRICARDGISPEQAQSRINSQPNDKFYEEHADFVIMNDKEPNALKEQVKNILKELRKGYI